jgi:hypothetical protein
MLLASPRLASNPNPMKTQLSQKPRKEGSKRKRRVNGRNRTRQVPLSLPLSLLFSLLSSLFHLSLSSSLHHQV